MKNHIQVSIFAISAVLAGASISASTPAHADSRYQNVEVAFVLDTTGSMSGLIEGAKQKIWSIANEIIDVEDNGQTRIRFALIGYRDRGDAYITRKFDMTDDIHGIYGNLLEFQAQGGGDRPESVNQALNEAISDLSWSKTPNTLRMVFLVGDAPPHMDYANEIQYPGVLAHANTHNIIVNTIQAGSDRETSRVWRKIAYLGQGDFAMIPQNGGMQVIQSPYDHDIEQLQQRVNRTSLGYGNEDQRKQFRSKRNRAVSASPETASDMAQYRLKAGKKNQVITGVQELVEDYEDGKVNLTTISKAALPKILQDLTPAQRKEKVEKLVAERSKLNQKLEALVKQRETFIDTKRAELESKSGKDAFDTQIRKTIERQMSTKKPKPQKLEKTP